MSQYDISKAAEYNTRKMFLDGTVNIQRFDKTAFQKIKAYEKIARGMFWVPEEVDITQDRQDMKKASPAQIHMLESNILRQTTLDSLQGKAPVQVFGPICSVPEMEALMNIWSFFETNIHSSSYSHIIQNAFANPSKVFDKVHDIQAIVDMAASVGKHYDALYAANCAMETGNALPLREHKKLIWYALHASFALEAIRFMVSFATSLALMEQGIFIGNGKIIEMILQDELLHTEWTAWIIQRIVKDDPEFLEIQEECVDDIYEMYKQVINEEKSWAHFLMQEGSIIGLNAKILESFVDYNAATKLPMVGIKFRGEAPRSNPIPWFEKYTNLSSQQTALQEVESTDYLTGALSSAVDLSELPDF